MSAYLGWLDYRGKGRWMMLKDKLKEEREAHGLSQSALADQLHVTRQAVSKWENGTAIPGIDILTELSGLYDMSLDQLIRDEAVEQDPAGDTADNGGEEQKWISGWEQCALLAAGSLVASMVPFIGLLFPIGVYYYKRGKYLFLCLFCVLVNIFISSNFI